MLELKLSRTAQEWALFIKTKWNRHKVSHITETHYEALARTFIVNIQWACSGIRHGIVHIIKSARKQNKQT